MLLRKMAAAAKRHHKRRLHVARHGGRRRQQQQQRQQPRTARQSQPCFPAYAGPSRLGSARTQSGLRVRRRPVRQLLGPPPGAPGSQFTVSAGGASSTLPTALHTCRAPVSMEGAAAATVSDDETTALVFDPLLSERSRQLRLQRESSAQLLEAYKTIARLRQLLRAERMKGKQQQVSEIEALEQEAKDLSAALAQSKCQVRLLRKQQGIVRLADSSTNKTSGAVVATTRPWTEPEDRKPRCKPLDKGHVRSVSSSWPTQIPRGRWRWNSAGHSHCSASPEEEQRQRQGPIDTEDQGSSIWQRGMDGRNGASPSLSESSIGVEEEDDRTTVADAELRRSVDRIESAMQDLESSIAECSHIEDADDEAAANEVEEELVELASSSSCCHWPTAPTLRDDDDTYNTDGGGDPAAAAVAVQGVHEELATSEVIQEALEAIDSMDEAELDEACMFCGFECTGTDDMRKRLRQHYGRGRTAAATTEATLKEDK